MFSGYRNRLLGGRRSLLLSSLHVIREPVEALLETGLLYRNGRLYGIDAVLELVELELLGDLCGSHGCLLPVSKLPSRAY